MNEFLTSLKSDLLDRRFLPVLVLLALALLAALGFAVLGGGSSTSPAPSPGGASTGVTGATGVIAITPAPAANSKQAVAETTSGAHKSSGTPRNPFTPLPSTSAKSATTSSSATHASGSSSSAGSEKSTSNAGGTTTTPSTIKPIESPKRVIIHFHTTVQFGVVPVAAEGTPPQPPQLQTFKDMAIDQPLPAKDNPQLVYLGVVLKTGKDAVFGLTGEAIVHGSGACKPSPTQCRAIELGIGQSETLEVFSPTGQPVTYELKLLSITKSVSSASAARAHAAANAKSRAGRALLRRAGFSELPGLRYSPRRGGLVSVGRRSFAAHAASDRR